MIFYLVFNVERSKLGKRHESNGGVSRGDREPRRGIESQFVIPNL